MIGNLTRHDVLDVDEWQMRGDVVGLKGRYLVDFGYEQVERAESGVGMRWFEDGSAISISLHPTGEYAWRCYSPEWAVVGRGRADEASEAMRLARFVLGVAT